MSPPAFTASVPLTSTPFTGTTITSRPTTYGHALSMSVADQFMSDSQTREAKQAATPFGVYTPQCTEGSGGANTAEATRLASLAASFRLRQSSPLARCADLFATRRAAIINAAGSHVDEQYAINYPARAAAGVVGKAEVLRACSRYFGNEDLVDEYMFECVDRQYKAMKVPYGEYSTSCCDGRTAGDAETARIAALATQYRAGTLDVKVRTQMRYDAKLQAVFTGRGCGYEEKYYLKYAKMSGAVRWSSGACGAVVEGVAEDMGGALASVEDLVEGVNLDSYWPSNRIRPAIKRETAPWVASPIKSYAPMSEAAVQFGIEAQSEPFVDSPYQGWSAGWQPKSSVVP